MTTHSTRRSTITTLLLFLLVLQVVIVATRLTTTIRAQDALPSAPALDGIEFPTPDMALTIQSGVERGNQVASAWSSDAVLTFASMQVDWPTGAPPETVTSVSPFGWIRLMYVAPIENGASDYAALSLLFERVSGKLAGASVSRWDVAPRSGNLLDGITVTDETAVLAAEVDKGTAYRSACPDKRNESIVSLTRDPATGDPVWNVSYDENGRNSSGSMLINVNAATGAVTEIRLGPDTCANQG
jgi:hypothetical protein